MPLIFLNPRAIHPPSVAIRRNYRLSIRRCWRLERRVLRSLAAPSYKRGMRKSSPSLRRASAPSSRTMGDASSGVHRQTIAHRLNSDGTGFSRPRPVRIMVETDRPDILRQLEHWLERSPLRTLAVLESVPVPPRPAASKQPSVAMTERQQDVARLLVRRLSNKEIARALALSHFTVRNHVSQILRLLGVASRKEAIEKLSSGMHVSQDHG